MAVSSRLFPGWTFTWFFKDTTLDALALCLNLLLLPAFWSLRAGRCHHLDQGVQRPFQVVLRTAVSDPHRQIS
jgi:hypothetical protein